MKNYRILTASKVDRLAEFVETALNDGWEIAGDIFLTHEKLINQPIIKTTTDRPSRFECHAENCNEPTVSGTNHCHFHQGAY